MLPEAIDLDIVTPEKRLVSLAVDEVVLPGTEGSMGVRPGHAPLLTGLEVGELMYRKGQEKRFVSVAGGFAEVLPRRVTILATIAERAEDIDRDRAERAKGRALERLEKKDPDTDIKRAQVALEKAVIRIEVAGKAHGGGA
jgi:F-type H+-transporting ATPase subunit epsilon